MIESMFESLDDCVHYFFFQNLYSNFGEIATNIKELMEHFQERHKNQSKIESINDMKVRYAMKTCQDDRNKEKTRGKYSFEKNND